jgi:hypothetical protein
MSTLAVIVLVIVAVLLLAMLVAGRTWEVHASVRVAQHARPRSRL